MDNISEKMNHFADQLFGDRIDKKTTNDNRDSIINQACELVLSDLGNYGIDDLDIIGASIKIAEEEVDFTDEEYTKVIAEYKKDDISKKEESKKEAVSPPGWGKTVEKMKEKHSDEIDNPFALAWYMKNKGYQPHPNKKSTLVEMTLESPVFNDVVVATINDVDEDNIIKRMSYDDEKIRKAYDVDTFAVEIPAKGRYLVEAINENVALDSVLASAFQAGELQDLMFQKKLSDIKANLLADGKVQRVSTTIIPKDTTIRTTAKKMTVVWEVPAGINLRVSDKEEPPAYVQNIVAEHEKDFNEYAENKISESIIRQATELIQEQFNDLRVPVNVTEVNVTKNEDGKISGTYQIESDKFNGEMAFTAEVEDNGVIKTESVKSELELLKGIYGLKEYEVKIADREFKTDAKNELEAVKKVMAFLEDQGDELTFEGRRFSAIEFDEVAEKIAGKNTKVIQVYKTPDDTVLGQYKIVEEDGKKYFSKA